MSDVIFSTSDMVFPTSNVVIGLFWKDSAIKVLL